MPKILVLTGLRLLPSTGQACQLRNLWYINFCFTVAVDVVQEFREERGLMRNWKRLGQGLAPARQVGLVGCLCVTALSLPAGMLGSPNSQAQASTRSGSPSARATQPSPKAHSLSPATDLISPSQPNAPCRPNSAPCTRRTRSLSSYLDRRSLRGRQKNLPSRSANNSSRPASLSPPSTTTRWTVGRWSLSM